MILDVREQRRSQVKIVLSRGAPGLHPPAVRAGSARGGRADHRDQGPGPRGRATARRSPCHQHRHKVDAVGACVGVRGSRIKNIVDELGGEKIDIVRWNESSQILIAQRPASRPRCRRSPCASSWAGRRWW